jgi:signal transduction histidine kinase
LRRRIVRPERRRFPLRPDHGGGLLLLGAGLVAAVLVQVRIGLRPVFEIRREIARVRRGKAQRLPASIPRAGPADGRLNALLDHNQEVVERQRTHVGNLAHALKTPISVMLAEAEAQPGALAEVVHRQVTAMRDHVDHHLRRARAAARAQGRANAPPWLPSLRSLCWRLSASTRTRGGDRLGCTRRLAFLGERQTSWRSSATFSKRLQVGQRRVSRRAIVERAQSAS